MIWTVFIIASATAGVQGLLFRICLVEVDYAHTDVERHDYLMAKTGGRRIEIEVNGMIVTCCTVGGLANAVGRSSRTIRDWERRGLIPGAPFVLNPNDVATRRRLYPLHLLEVLERVMKDERFGRRRPSGRFLRQQGQIYTAWNEALEPLRQSDGFTAEDPDDSPRGVGRLA